MCRETIKDARFRILGYIDSAIDGKLTGRDAHFQMVGFYDPKANTTKDVHFRAVGYGNLLTSLIGRR